MESITVGTFLKISLLLLLYKFYMYDVKGKTITISSYSLVFFRFFWLLNTVSAHNEYVIDTSLKSLLIWVYIQNLVATMNAFTKRTFIFRFFFLEKIQSGMWRNATFYIFRKGKALCQKFQQTEIPQLYIFNLVDNY